MAATSSRLSPAAKFLALLMIGDAIFLALHFTEEMRFLWRPMFRLTRERGLAEIFQYSKELFCAAVFASFAVRFRSVMFLFSSVLMFFLFLDDFIGLHEYAGGLLGSMATGVESNYSYNLGQIWYGVAAVVLLSCALIVLWIRTDDDERWISGIFMLFIGALAFFAVAVDAIPTVLPTASLSMEFWVVLEETGEHLALSGAAWWSLTSWLDLRGKEGPYASSPGGNVRQ